MKKPQLMAEKTQIYNVADGASVPHQEQNEKGERMTRKMKDGKLVVQCIRNNVTCVQIYRKSE